ncbi:MAG: hypothetical protein ABI459_01485 [Deltaproteobacteria bacterium]
MQDGLTKTGQKAEPKAGAMLSLLRAVFGIFGGSRAKNAPLQPLTREQLIEALILKADSDDAESKFLKERLDQVLGYMEESNWDELSELLSEWDMEGEVSPTGIRLAQMVLDQIWTGKAGAIHDPLMPTPRISSDLEGPLAHEVEEAHQKRPEDYVVSSLLARLNLGRAWNWREMAATGEGQNDSEADMAMAFATAADAIAPFDPVKLMSPMVARLRYQYLMARGDVSALTDAFDTLVSLDVGNLDTYRSHGSHVLASANGDHVALEEQAREVLARTEMEIGAAAYAAMYQIPLQYNAKALMGLDFDLFEAGLQEIIALASDDQYTVNRICNELLTLANLPYEESVGDKGPFEQRQKEIKVILKAIVEDHMKVLLPYLWDCDEQTARERIGVLFSDDIRAGKRIVIGAPDGSPTGSFNIAA